MKETSMKKSRQKSNNGRASQAASDGLNRWNLRLYVFGQTRRSVTAFKNLKEICEEYLKGQYTLRLSI